MLTKNTFYSHLASNLNQKAARANLCGASAAYLEARDWLLSQGFYTMSMSFSIRTGWSWHVYADFGPAWARIIERGSDTCIVEMLVGVESADLEPVTAEVLR